MQIQSHKPVGNSDNINEDCIDIFYPENRTFNKIKMATELVVT